MAIVGTVVATVTGVLVSAAVVVSLSVSLLSRAAPRYIHTSSRRPRRRYVGPTVARSKPYLEDCWDALSLREKLGARGFYVLTNGLRTARQGGD